MGVGFDDLHFTESFLSPPRMEGGDLIVDVRQVYVPREDDPRTDEPRSGRLRFYDVVRSERTLYAYIGAPNSGQGFKPARISIDVEIGGAKPFNEYLFGGVQLERVAAWVEWRVHAADFELTLD